MESGKRPRGGVKKYSAGIPSIGGEHLDGRGGFRLENVRYVPRDYYQLMSKGKIEPSDILVVKDGATTGKTAIVSSDFPFKEAAVNEHVFILRTIGELLEPCFLFRFLSSDQGQRQILRRFQGSAQGGINMTFVKDFPVPLAPFSEQKRIVAKVEILFAESRAVREALDKVPILLRRFRRSVLVKAFRGELTQRDPADEPAKILLNRIRNKKTRVKDASKHEDTETELAKREATPELPKEWEYATLEETSEYIIDCLHSTPNFQESGKYCIDTTCIDESQIDFDRARRVSEQTFLDRTARLKPKGGDVLFGREGTIGNAALVPENVEICLGQRTMLFRLWSEILPSYFMWALNSPIVRNQIKPLIVGTTAPHVNIGDMKKVLLPMAPIGEQMRIAAKVENLFSFGKSVLDSVEKSRNYAMMIDQAILAKAFRGELISQDPNDEPASTLLQRIKSTAGQRGSFQTKFAD